MKRTKLLVSLMMCVMCLSFLVIGVWAAVVSVNFNLNAGLKYYPEGVYVELSGQVYRGCSADSLTALTYDPRFTLSPTTNYDNSTGEPSGNFPIESWDIGAIPFIPTEKVVKIEVTVVNHSEIAIIGTPSILVDENQEISTITNLSVTENKLDVAYIQAGNTAVYELILEVTDSSEINNTLSVSFDFSAPEVNYNYFTILGNQITGLTGIYTTDSPEVLVIPGYTQDGQNSLSIKSGSSAAVWILNNITSSVVVIDEGLTSIGDFAFAPSNNIKVINIPSTCKSVGSYNYFPELEKTYFSITEGWKRGDGLTISSEALSDPTLAGGYIISNGYGIGRT